MKNLNLFPFERNRYFYGKFLSVEDFETEQRYMNDKRRFLNRILHGCGVVCGLQVVEADDVTISLEAGLALDFSGREIVVPAPVTRRLSAIEGFSSYAESEDAGAALYLCIAYAEEPIEPVCNITRVNEEQEEEYNKYAESYRLFVTEEAPEYEGAQTASLYEDSCTLFQGAGIRIRQTVPKYVKSGEEAEIVITVEKGEQTPPAAFSYQLRLNYMEYQGQSLLTIDFDENRFSPSDTYVLKQRVWAKAVEGVEGSVEAVADSFRLFVGADSRKADICGRFKVMITKDSIPETVVKNYYQAAMEDMTRDAYGSAIYLAKLDMIQAGDTYVIGKVETLPFQQYVWSGMLSASLETFWIKQEFSEKLQQIQEAYLLRREADRPAEKKYLPDADAAGQAASQMQIKTGSLIINLGIGGVPGKRFYTDEIIHGLGPGEVYVSLGAARGIQENSQIIFGDPDIFGENAAPQIALAARVNPARGSFIIGLRCTDYVEAKKLRIHWLAVKDNSHEEHKVKHMTVRPDIVHLKVRESCCFEAFIGGEVQKHVKWSVREAEGGSIDHNGCYTAPSQAGVYTLIAESMEEEQLKAAAYAIVQDM